MGRCRPLISLLCHGHPSPHHFPMSSHVRVPPLRSVGFTCDLNRSNEQRLYLRKHELWLHHRIISTHAKPGCISKPLHPLNNLFSFVDNIDPDNIKPAEHDAPTGRTVRRRLTAALRAWRACGWCGFRRQCARSARFAPRRCGFMQVEPATSANPSWPGDQDERYQAPSQARLPYASRCVTCSTGLRLVGP